MAEYRLERLRIRQQQLVFLPFGQVVGETREEDGGVLDPTLRDGNRPGKLPAHVARMCCEAPPNPPDRRARPGGQPHQPGETIGSPEARVSAERLIAAVARQRADDAAIADRA